MRAAQRREPDQGYWHRSSEEIRGGVVATATVYATAKRTLERSPGPGQMPIMIEPVYCTYATTMLIVEFANPVAAMLLTNQLGARAFDPNRITIPLTTQTCISAQYEVKRNVLRIRRRNRSMDSMMSIKVTERFAYLLSLTGSLSVNIRSGKQNWYVTVVDPQSWNGLPSVAGHPGPLNAGAMEHSTRWSAVCVPPSVMIDDTADDVENIASWTYGASTVKKNIPKPNSYHRHTCVRCGRHVELNREHCTPKWLTDMLNVEPVVGRILCPACNGHFGDAFEARICKLYAEGKFHDPHHQELICRWALKTALTLTSMSNIQPPAWMWQVVDGQPSPPTLHTYHLRIPALPDRGYLYSVTRFPPDMTDAFCFTLTFDNEMFVIVHSADQEETLVDFVHNQRGGEPIHESAIRHYFGVSLERDAAVLTPSTRR